MLYSYNVAYINVALFIQYFCVRKRAYVYVLVTSNHISFIEITLGSSISRYKESKEQHSTIMNVSSTSDYLAKWCYCNYWCMLHFTIEVFIYIHWYWELDDKKTFYSMEYIRLPSTTKITTFEFSCCMGAKVYFIGGLLIKWSCFTLQQNNYLC